MWGDRHAWERERGSMYCELEGGVRGGIDTLGNEKETVCIVSWEGVYVGRSTRLRYEKATVCIVSGEGVYVGKSTRLGFTKKLYLS